MATAALNPASISHTYPGLDRTGMMSAVVGSFLPEIYESVSLIRDLVLKDQLPHFKATIAVKEQLASPNGLATSLVAAQALQNVQDRFQEQGLSPWGIASLNQPSVLVTDLDADGRVASSGLYQAEWTPSQDRLSKPLRHQTFESRAQDESTKILTLAQLKKLTSNVMNFAQHDFSLGAMSEPAYDGGLSANKRVFDDASSFDENDYYSSQVDSSATSSPRHRSRRPAQMMSHSMSVVPGLGIGSSTDLYGRDDMYRDGSEDSDDYAPPAAAHEEASDDLDEYDPMQLEPESDYDPNDLDDNAPATAKQTPVVTSQPAQIEAPRPSRVTTHTVSKMSHIANAAILQSPFRSGNAALNLPGGVQTDHIPQVSIPNNGNDQYPLSTTTAQHISQATTSLPQNNIDWVAALQQLSATSTNDGGMASLNPYLAPAPEQVSTEKVSQPARKVKIRNQEQRQLRREKKREKREAKMNAKKPKASGHPPPSAPPPPQYHTHVDTYNAQPGASNAYQGMMPPPPQLDTFRTSPYGQQIPPPALQLPTSNPYGNPYTPSPAEYGVQYPLHMQPTQGRPLSVAPLAPELAQYGPSRVLAAGETTIVRDQHGNVYFARPVPSAPVPVYRYPPY